MSLSSISQRLRTAQQDVSRIQKRIADISRDEARSSRNAADAQRRLGRASSPSQTDFAARDIERCQDELARLAEKRAHESQDLARKQEDVARLQEEYYREQEREQAKTRDILSRFDKMAIHDRSTVTSRVRELALPANVSTDATYNAFVCHASEDKEELVRPLADELKGLGNNIWYDEFALKVGDSLRRWIDHGLSRSRFGIVVLSPSFFAKNWTQYELDGLVAKEVEGHKVILPLWHRVSKDDVMKYSPTLADRVALNTAMYSVKELAAMHNDRKIVALVPSFFDRAFRGGL